jgi:Zn-dependent peptidase ImmA (M78 family)
MTQRPHNSYLSKIFSVAGSDDPQCAVERLLRGYRDDRDTLRTIASKCGVDAIIEEPLPFDGGIFELPADRIVIKLNSYANATRKKFTLAHEIGHLLIASISGKSRAMSCRRSAHLERACDMIAAELLMPSAQVRMAVEELKFSSPQNLKVLADRFGVSLLVAARRVHDDLRLWSRQIGMWKWDSSPSEVWFVGKRPWNTRNPGYAAFETARQSQQTVRSYDVTRRGDSVEPISLELLNLGRNYILGLIGVAS